MLSEERDDPFALWTLRQPRQSIQHRQVGLAGAVLLQTLASRHVRRALLGRVVNQRIDQRRLADPGLARDENDLTLAGRRALEPLLHRGELGAAPEQTCDGR